MVIAHSHHVTKVVGTQGKPALIQVQTLRVDSCIDELFFLPPTRPTWKPIVRLQ